MVISICNTSNRKEDVFEATLSYIGRLCLKTNQQTQYKFNKTKYFKYKLSFRKMTKEGSIFLRKKLHIFASSNTYLLG